MARQGQKQGASNLDVVAQLKQIKQMSANSALSGISNQRGLVSPLKNSHYHDLYLRTQIDKEISEKKDLFRSLLDTEDSARREEDDKDNFEPASVLDRPAEPTLKKDNSTKFIDSLLFDITKSSGKIQTLNILQEELNDLYVKQGNLDAKEGLKKKAQDGVLNEIAAALKR